MNLEIEELEYILPLCIAGQVGRIPEGHPWLKENQLLTSSLRALGYSSPICTLSVLQEVWLFGLEAKSGPPDPFFLSAETSNYNMTPQIIRQALRIS